MFLLAIGLAGSENLVGQEPPKSKSFIQISPFAGINLDKKIFVYGGEMGYEYRLNNRWSLVGNVVFSTGSTNNAKRYYAGSTLMIVDHQRVNEYGVGFGAKYYIGKFNVSGGLGYGRYDQTLRGRYDYPGIEPANAATQDATTSKYGMYQNFALGYSIPLENQNTLKIFMKGYGTRDLNIATGLRYSFGLGKK